MWCCRYQRELMWCMQISDWRGQLISMNALAWNNYSIPEPASPPSRSRLARESNWFFSLSFPHALIFRGRWFSPSRACPDRQLQKLASILKLIAGFPSFLRSPLCMWSRVRLPVPQERDLTWRQQSAHLDAQDLHDGLRADTAKCLTLKWHWAMQ